MRTYLYLLVAVENWQEYLANEVLVFVQGMADEQFLQNFCNSPFVFRAKNAPRDECDKVFSQSLVVLRYQNLTLFSSNQQIKYIQVVFVLVNE